MACRHEMQVRFLCNTKVIKSQQKLRKQISYSAFSKLDTFKRLTLLLVSQMLFFLKKLMKERHMKENSHCLLCQARGIIIMDRLFGKPSVKDFITHGKVR